MKRTILLFLVIHAAGGCLATQERYAYQALHLVYHSDTRGYVQPCG